MKYLVALDGSKDAERAFDVVLCKATEQDHVFLLMVAEEVYVSAVGGASAYIDYSYIVRANQQIEEETKALLRSYGRRLTARKIPHTLLMGKGDPKEVLVREADAREVEMLVIGRRGLGRFKRFFLGSVSQYCVENAKCSVWVIKNPHFEEAEAALDVNPSTAEIL